MNWKALLCGTVLGCMAAWLPSCGHSGTTADGGTLLSDGGTCTGSSCADGGSDDCNATSCPSGCCSEGTCRLGTSTRFCGQGGAACTACSTGQNCSSQACTTGGAANVGDACTQNADCAGLGAAYQCKLTTSSGNATYQGGMCTKTCASNSDCPSGTSVCVPGQNLYGEADSLCWADCALGGDCRSPGYACYQLGVSSAVKACWISPLPVIDAGTPAGAGVEGSACTTTAACQPPESGVCILETLPDGGQSGFPGGECTADCSRSPAICGRGGTCVGFRTEHGVVQSCHAECNDPGQGQSSCRPNWVCGELQAADGGIAAKGWCQPNCNAPGSGCASGTTCRANDAGPGAGYCCDATSCY